METLRSLAAKWGFTIAIVTVVSALVTDHAGTAFTMVVVQVNGKQAILVNNNVLLTNKEMVESFFAHHMVW